MKKLEEIIHKIEEELAKLEGLTITLEKIKVFNVWILDRKEIQEFVNSYYGLMVDEQEEKVLCESIVNFVKSFIDSFKRNIFSLGYFHENLDQITEVDILKGEPQGSYWLRPSSLKAGITLCRVVSPNGLQGDQDILRQRLHFDKNLGFINLQALLNLPTDQSIKQYKNSGLLKREFEKQIRAVKQQGLGEDQLQGILLELFKENKNVTVVTLYGGNVNGLRQSLVQQFQKNPKYPFTTEWLVFALPVPIYSSVTNHSVAVVINLKENVIHYHDEHYLSTINNANYQNFKTQILPALPLNLDLAATHWIRNTEFNQKDDWSCTIRSIGYIESCINNPNSNSQIEKKLEDYYLLWLKHNKTNQLRHIEEVNILNVIKSYLRVNLSPTNLSQVDPQKVNSYGWIYERNCIALFWPSLSYYDKHMQSKPRPVFSVPFCQTGVDDNKQAIFTLKYGNFNLQLKQENHKYSSYFVLQPESVRDLQSLLRDKYCLYVRNDIDEQMTHLKNELCILYRKFAGEKLNNNNNNNTNAIDVKITNFGTYLSLGIDNIANQNFYNYLWRLQHKNLLTTLIAIIYGELQTIHTNRNLPTPEQKFQRISNTFKNFLLYVNSLSANYQTLIFNAKSTQDYTITYFANVSFNQVERNFPDFLRQMQELVEELNYIEDQLPAENTAVNLGQIKIIIPKEPNLINEFTSKINESNERINSELMKITSNKDEKLKSYRLINYLNIVRPFVYHTEKEFVFEPWQLHNDKIAIGIKIDSKWYSSGGFYTKAALVFDSIVSGYLSSFAKEDFVMSKRPFFDQIVITLTASGEKKVAEQMKKALIKFYTSSDIERFNRAIHAIPGFNETATYYEKLNAQKIQGGTDEAKIMLFDLIYLNYLKHSPEFKDIFIYAEEPIIMPLEILIKGNEQASKAAQETLTNQLQTSVKKLFV